MFILRLTLIISMSLSCCSVMAYSDTYNQVDNCSHLKTSCEYYLCLETQKKCGSKGYLKSFGHAYCYKFENTVASSFSPKGRKWLKEVRECLIDELSQMNPKISCSKLKKQAFDSHIPCYKKTHFCRLSKYNKYQVMKSIASAIKDPKIISAGFEILKSCKWTPF